MKSSVNENSTPSTSVYVIVTVVASQAGAGTSNTGTAGVTGAGATSKSELITHVVPAVLAYTVPELFTSAVKLPSVIDVLKSEFKEYSSPSTAVNVIVTVVASHNGAGTVNTGATGVIGAGATS